MARKRRLLAVWVGVMAGLGLPLVSHAQTPAVPEVSQGQGITETHQAGRLHSEAGRFSVQVPIELQAASTTTAVVGETLTWTIAQATQGETVFAVAYTDLPLEVLEMGQEVLIQHLREKALVEGVNWEAIANRGQPIIQGEFSGLEFLDLTHEQVSAVRFFLANRRLYAVVAASPDLHTVNQFLTSFTLDSLWRPFVSEEGKFRVDLPMAPVLTPQPMTYQGAPLTWWQYMGYNLHAPEDRYGFAYVDLPEGVSSEDEVALLNGVAELVLTELNAPELAGTATPIGLEGYPGQEYRLTHASGKTYVMRLYLVDRRLYGFLASSKSLNNLDRFLNSFEVIQ